MLFDTDAEEHFLVFPYPIHLPVQACCIKEDGIIHHVYFQHAMKIQNSQLSFHAVLGLFPSLEEIIKNADKAICQLKGARGKY